jgi:hypothetical protein
MGQPEMGRPPHGKDVPDEPAFTFNYFSRSAPGRTAQPWYLNAISYNAATGVTSGTLSGIDVSVSGSDCNAEVDGTAAGADNGTVKWTYSNSTGKLTYRPTGGNLHLYNVSGCLGVLSNGDSVRVSGTGPVTPTQTITSSSGG